MFDGELGAGRRYHCPFRPCDKDFARKADYQRHRNSHHLKLK